MEEARNGSNVQKTGGALAGGAAHGQRGRRGEHGLTLGHRERGWTFSKPGREMRERGRARCGRVERERTDEEDDDGQWSQLGEKKRPLLGVR